MISAGKNIAALRYIVLASILVLCYRHDLFAEEKKEIQKYTIAVSNFDANNCKPALSRAVTDILAGKIFNVDFFILLERNQMDLIMREKGIIDGKLTNASEAARVGKILSVQKMVVGSLSKLGRYFRLEARVVNVENGRVDVSLSEEAGDEGGLEKAAKKIAENIERYYLGFAIITGMYDFSINGSVVHAFGRMAHGVGFGFGCNANFYWNRPFGWPVPFIFSAGFYAFPPTIETIKSFYMVPIEIHAGYKFSLSKNISLLPWAGGGYILSRVAYDNRKRVITNHNYKSGFYYNPVLTIGVELNIFFHNRFILLFTPVYNVFFEKRKVGQFTGADIGLKILF